MPEEEKALPEPSRTNDDGPSTRRSMTSGLREASTEAKEVKVELEDPGVTPMVSVADLAPAPPPSTPAQDDVPPPGSETTLVSSPSALPSTPRSSRGNGPSRSRGGPTSSPSPTSSRSPNTADGESRAWIAVWVVAGVASIAVGVYLALHG